MNLGTLRTLAREKADEEATGFISDAALNRSLNQGLKFIYGKIAQRFEDFFITKGTALNGGLISTVSGTQSYALPTTCKKLVKVESRNSNETDDNLFRRVDRLNINNDIVGQWYAVWPDYNQTFGYFVAGDQIHLRPVPTSVFQLRLWFVPQVTEMSLDADTPGIPSEFHELISEYGALQCLRKSGEGIYKENFEAFTMDLNNLIETIEIRDQQPEQMTVTEIQDPMYREYNILR
jgi:hypothetical protein